jgi:plastocyanin
MRDHRGFRLVAGLMLGAALLPIGLANAVAAGPSVVVIGVDHFDPANQDFAHGRLFEYTDFFTRSVTVHQGEVVNFRTAPGAFHIIGLGPSDAVARKTYPVALTDADDPNASTGAPKIAFGPSNYPIVHGNTAGDLSGVDFTRPNGPPHCGRPDLHQADCVFSGGTDIEVAGPNVNQPAKGPPLAADWRVKITAKPGTYAFTCYIHPGMNGQLHVVAGSAAATTQAQIDAQSATQFAADRAAGLALESMANRVRWTGGAPGTRTYLIWDGAGTSDGHVAIDEIFPNPATVKGGAPTVKQGDTVRYIWADRHNVHSLYFPSRLKDTAPFGFDCDTGFRPFGNGPPGPPCIETGEKGGPEVIADPGTTASGTVLTRRTIDAGLRAGKAYGLSSSSQSWSAVTNATTKPGRYTFKCTLHDWMVGAVIVTT